VKLGEPKEEALVKGLMSFGERFMRFINIREESLCEQLE
jgi:hypothetical protein